MANSLEQPDNAVRSHRANGGILWAIDLYQKARKPLSIALHCTVEFRSGSMLLKKVELLMSLDSVVCLRSKVFDAEKMGRTRSATYDDDTAIFRCDGLRDLDATEGERPQVLYNGGPVEFIACSR